MQWYELQALDLATDYLACYRLTLSFSWELRSKRTCKYWNCLAGRLKIRSRRVDIPRYVRLCDRDIQNILSTCGALCVRKCMRRLPSWENWRVLQIREERERWPERSFIAMHLIFTVLPDDFKGTLRNQRGLKDHLGEDPGRGIRNLDPGRDIEIKR